MRDQVIPRQVCPFCGYSGYTVDRTEGLETRQPKVGDISLCLKCMEVSLFGIGFILRQPTVNELIEVQRSTAWVKIEQARSVWRRLGIKNQITEQGR